MNSLTILYHIIKAQIINTVSNIKSLFKKKPKLEQKPCYTSEVTIGNYHVLNLLKEIKVVDFNNKKIETFKDIIEILNEYSDVKTVFISTFLQNVILNVSEKYPNHLIYIEDFKPDKLLIKVHLIDLNIFKEIFVLNDQTHKELFDDTISHDDLIGFKVVKSSDGQSYNLIEQRYNGSIYYGNVIRLNSSFKSVLDIINNYDDITLYCLNETFTNKILSELPNINDQIIDVLLSGKNIENFVLINKIL